MLNKRILVLIFLLVFLPLVGCFPSNQAPIINSIPVTGVTVGETYVYDVEATDPNDDTLIYSLTVKPMGMTINPATGLIEWSPTAEGNYAVVVKVSDGALDIIQSFTIVVIKPYTPPPVNHAPIITSNPNLASLVGIQYTYTIKATDPDGDTLTYYLVSGPKGMTFDTPTISWTPETIGSYDVTVEVSDGKLSDIQSFTIIVKAVELTSIVVLPKTMTLFVGNSDTIKSVTAHYNDGSTAKIPVLTFEGGTPACECESRNENVATVTDTGLVAAIKEGTTTIIVSYGGKIDTIAVTVTYLQMEIMADDLLTFIVNEPGEFTASLVANSDAGRFALAYLTLPVGTKLYYYEVYPTEWCPSPPCWLDLTYNNQVDVVFGPEAEGGFPLEDITIDFRAKFTEVGNYPIIVEIREVDTGITLGSKVITFEVIDLVRNTNTGEYYHTIQDAIDDDDLTSGDTIEVSPGTYNEDVTINKSLILVSTEGKYNTIINGQNIGYTGAVVIAADDVVFGGDGTGFTVNGSGTAAVYFSQPVSRCLIEDNNIKATSGKRALLTVGGQSNHNIIGNTFSGDPVSQLVYVNGQASVSVPSINVDFIGNTFAGTAPTGPALGQEATDSEISGNTFATVTGYAVLELWATGNTIIGNDFTADLPVGEAYVLDSSKTYDLAEILNDNTFLRDVAIVNNEIVVK